jgi:hypothetical protein
MGYRSVVILAVAGLSVGLSGCCAIWEHGDKHEEDGRAVSLDMVPAPVKATILKEAGDHKVTEVEEITKGAATTYEADWLVEGEEVEIRVAADGTLGAKEPEPADDDDDHGSKDDDD